MSLRSALALLGLLAVTGAAAATNDPATAVIRGRALARQLLQQWPATHVTQTGVLKIRDAGKRRSQVPIRCEVRVTGTNWSSFYAATFTNRVETLLVIHAADRPNQYFYDTLLSNNVPILGDIPVLGHLFRGHELAGAAAMVPFAGSDFWLADLGLEFFHWPDQKILRHEFCRTRGCDVLESTNPDPATNGYSRVLTWIDTEGGGIVQAEAYDAGGKLLKEFYPKDLKKVDGQWQVQTMDISNVQTRSQTRMDFDLKPE